jgi:hypothetical protein
MIPTLPTVNRHVSEAIDLRRIVVTAVTASLFLFLAACATSPYALSDRAAKDIFVHIMNDPARATLLPLGNLSVVSSMHERFEGVKGNDKISQEAFAYYQNLKREDLITITNYRDLTKGFQGWNSFFALSQQGIAQQFSAEPTAKANSLVCPDATLKAFAITKALCLSDGQLQTATVTQNQLLTSGSDYYRVVRGFHEWSWNPVFVKIMEKRKGEFGRERKFAMLLKFDPFKKNWSSVAMDVGNRDVDLLTNGVEKMTAGMTAVN